VASEGYRPRVRGKVDAREGPIRGVGERATSKINSAQRRRRSSPCRRWRQLFAATFYGGNGEGRERGKRGDDGDQMRRPLAAAVGGILIGYWLSEKMAGQEGSPGGGDKRQEETRNDAQCLFFSGRRRLRGLHFDRAREVQRWAWGSFVSWAGHYRLMFVT